MSVSPAVTTVSDRPLRIAMIAACPFPYPRGTPTRVLRMAEALAGRGHEIHVVTYHLGDGGENQRLKVHRTPSVRTYTKVSPGPSYQKLVLLDTLLAWTLLGVLRRYPIDVVHAHHYEGLLVALLARRRSRHPVIYDAHTTLESELPYYRLGLPHRFKRRFGYAVDGFLPSRASHVVTVSDEIKSKLVKRGQLNANRVTVAPSGVECGRFPVDCRANNNGASKTIIYTGNLAAYQRIDLLLKSFASVCATVPSARLLMVTNSSFDRFEALSRGLGIRDRIEVTSSDFEALPQYLARAQVAVNPRIDCDGLPQKLLNYMAAGKAIVSFRGSAKFLTHGELGWVAEDGDVAALAGGIVHLIENSSLARRLGDRARQHVAATMSWETTAATVEGVYAKILGAGKKGNTDAQP